mmetsp:Transcript_5063/g.10536  ORF Transcript_5063/g.10536 Transcript_5063/m.10536 type:complete len:604 (-) Transcript_5063:366-2177(-)
MLGIGYTSDSESGSDSDSASPKVVSGVLENSKSSSTSVDTNPSAKALSSSATSSNAKSSSKSLIAYNYAPNVGAVDLDLSEASRAMAAPVSNNTKTVSYNMKASSMLARPEGPANPFARHQAQVSEAAVDEAAFDADCYAKPKKSSSICRFEGREGSKGPGGEKGQMQSPIQRRKRRKSDINAQMSKLLKRVISSDGPWVSGGPDEDGDSGDGGVDNEEISETQRKILKAQEGRRNEAAKRAQEKGTGTAFEEHVLVQRGEDIKSSTEFHGTQEVDYQGRSWISVPPTLRTSEGHDAYLPKRLLFQFNGHEKGVSKISFFPKYGHMLLSSSLDGTLKMWAVYESCLGGRGLMRTYSGHKDAVCDHCFNATGDKFASSSYDKTIRVWDAESGQTIISLSNGSTANCVRFSANDDNIVLAGCTNNQIVQWDLREGKIVQRYTNHDAPVNTITIFDEGRRFLSSSDDKTLLVWDLNTPVPIKHISDPSMQSMPFITISPDQRFFACQSMDNQIVTYEMRERFRNCSKRFSGHNSAGYALPIDFSPNSKYLMSGDLNGKLFFWSWNSCKKVRELKVHNQATQGAVWHPVEPSWVATCSWDGFIKVWG